MNSAIVVLSILAVWLLTWLFLRGAARNLNSEFSSRREEDVDSGDDCTNSPGAGASADAESPE